MEGKNWVSCFRPKFGRWGFFPVGQSYQKLTSFGKCLQGNDISYSFQIPVFRISWNSVRCLWSCFSISTFLPSHLAPALSTLPLPLFPSFLLFLWIQMCLLSLCTSSLFVFMSIYLAPNLSLPASLSLSLSYTISPFLLILVSYIYFCAQSLLVMKYMLIAAGVRADIEK